MRSEFFKSVSHQGTTTADVEISVIKQLSQLENNLERVIAAQSQNQNLPHLLSGIAVLKECREKVTQVNGPASSVKNTF